MVEPRVRGIELISLLQEFARWLVVKPHPFMGPEVKVNANNSRAVKMNLMDARRLITF